MPIPPDLGDRVSLHAGEFPGDDIRLVVKVVVLVAFADLEIDEAEHAGIRRALNKAYGDAVSLDTIDGHIEKTRREIQAAGGAAHAHRIGEQLAERGLSSAGLALGASIAAASNGISDDERVRLAALAKGAGLGPDALAEAEQAAMAATR